MTERVLVVGWDGLRPDLVDPAQTPNLWRLIASGTRFAAATAAFPSETRPNNASIGTGCYPGRHGITANALYADLGDGPRPIDSGRPDHLAEIRRHRGRLLDCQTLGEVLSGHGRRLAVIGSGSPGQTLLQNPHGAGWTINRAVREPAWLDGAIAAARGPWPDATAGTGAIDDDLMAVALDYVVPEYAPDALVLWSCEPDVALHAHGLGSAEVAAALRANDTRLGRLLDRLERDRQLADTTVMFVSDHGHSTVRDTIDLGAALRDAGLVDPGHPGDVVTAGPGIHLDGRAVERLADIAAWLQRQPWCGPVFVRDDRWSSALTGTLPASVLWDGAPGRWVPDLQFSPAWDDQPNAAGVPGRADRVGNPGKPIATNHGSLSPRDMNNVMALAGPRVRRGAVVDAPAGTIDIAPTVLDLLGLPVPTWMQGRPLREALDGGPPDPAVALEPLLEAPWGRLVRRRVDGTAYVAVEPREGSGPMPE